MMKLRFLVLTQPHPQLIINWIARSAGVV